MRARTTTLVGAVGLAALIAGLVVPYARFEFFDEIVERTYLRLDLPTASSYLPLLWSAAAIAYALVAVTLAMRGRATEMSAGAVATIGGLMVAAWMQVVVTTVVVGEASFAIGAWLWLGGAVALALAGISLRPRVDRSFSMGARRRPVLAAVLVGVACIALGSVLPFDSLDAHRLWAGSPEFSEPVIVRINAGVLLALMLAAAIAGMRVAGPRGGGFSRGVLFTIGAHEVLTWAGYLAWLLSSPFAGPRAGLFLMLAGGVILAGAALRGPQSVPRRTGNLGGARVVVTPRGGLID